MKQNGHSKIEPRAFIAFLAMGLCVFGALFYENCGLSIIKGRMQVALVGENGAAGTTGAIADVENPEAQGSTRISYSEVIYLTAPEGISQMTKAAVAATGLLRLLPQIAALVLLALMCFHVGRGRVFSQTNTKLVLSAGIVLLAASVLVPLINQYGIPALVNAAGGNRIGIGEDTTGNLMYFLYGFVLLFLSGIFRSGERAWQKALAEKKVEMQKNA